MVSDTPMTMVTRTVAEAEVEAPPTPETEAAEPLSPSPRAPANVQIHEQWVSDAVVKTNALVRSIVEKYELGDQSSLRNSTLSGIGGG